MTDGTLYLGTKRYSSWSLRGWLPVRLAGLNVAEVVIPLAGGSTPGVKAVSPGGTVPYLEHQGAAIWESLAMPMALVRPGAAGTCATDGALADIARIDALWQDTRARFGAGGPYLFGPAFGNADAMFAPVVARFLTYAPALSPVAQAYCTAVRAHPLVAAWYDAAAAEPADWFLEKYETAPAPPASA